MVSWKVNYRSMIKHSGRNGPQIEMIVFTHMPRRHPFIRAVLISATVSTISFACPVFLYDFNKLECLTRLEGLTGPLFPMGRVSEPATSRILLHVHRPPGNVSSD